MLRMFNPFLLPNCISTLQPLYLQIIHAATVHYRLQLMWLSESWCNNILGGYSDVYCGLENIKCCYTVIYSHKPWVVPHDRCSERWSGQHRICPRLYPGIITKMSCTKNYYRLLYAVNMVCLVWGFYMYITIILIFLICFRVKKFNCVECDIVTSTTSLYKMSLHTEMKEYDMIFM